jgi:hypothetical protein
VIRSNIVTHLSPSYPVGLIVTYRTSAFAFSVRHRLAEVKSLVPAHRLGVPFGALTEGDAATTLDAGGDVSDKELAAARHACAHLQQSGLDAGTRIRVDHAASTLSDEQQRRQASHC